MTTYTLVPQGLVYMADLSGFTCRLATADHAQLQECAKALHDQFFVPIAQETLRICRDEPAPGSEHNLQVGCALVNTPGDAAILVFCRIAGQLPFDYLVDRLSAMTHNLPIRAAHAGGPFQVKVGMDVGPLVKCGKPFMGGPGVWEVSSDMSFSPDFFIGDVINRLARILSSRADRRHAVRLSSQLWSKMPEQYRQSRSAAAHHIGDYPDKGSHDQLFYTLEEAHD